jgi:hypothetical protein
MRSRVTNDPPLRPAATDLELRLHEGDDWREAVGPQRRRDRPENEAKRDERDVDDGDVDRLTEGRRVEMARVEPIVDDDSGIASDPVGELPATDVHGMNAGRSTLEENIGEAARGRPRVQRDKTGRVDRERVKRCRELVPAATDVRLLGDELDVDLRVHEIARSAIEPRGVTDPRPDLPGKDQRLSAGAGVGEPTLDDELVKALTGTGTTSRGGAHAAIVAQPPSRRLMTGPRGRTAVDRSATWIWSVGLHLLIGMSGALAGIPLVSAFLGGGLDQFRPSQRDVVVAGAIAFGVLGYGVASILAGIGVWRGSRAAWWLALVVDLAGLGVLFWTVALTSFSDALLLGGFALWVVTLVLLLAPGTRAAVAR